MPPIRGKTPGKTPKKPARKDLIKDPIQVYCRVRPLDEKDTDSCVEIYDETSLKLTPPDATKLASYKESHHTFQHVFDPLANQAEVFHQVTFPLIEDLISGKNGLLFAYGVTSSGKTHTMTGNPTDGGVLPRALDVIFNSIGEIQSKRYVFKPDAYNGFDVQSDADAMLERQRRELMPPTTPIGTPKGTPKTPHSKKVTPTFDDLFRVPDEGRTDRVVDDNLYAVFVSYIEIYNNYIYDLLDDVPNDPINPPQPQSKILREDSSRNMYVSGVNEVEVKSTQEAFAQLMKGQKRRRVGSTSLNKSSSRSHSIFNVRLVQAPCDPLGEEVHQDKTQICSSQLSLVDLAGSERSARTGIASGNRLREAGNINTSLMVLRTCMEVLRENQQATVVKNVPYRDSKLTHLFKNYFDGEGKVRMVVCVNPRADDYIETTHVMKFAEISQEVQVARPQEIQFDKRFLEGRRKAHQLYKNALRRLSEQGLVDGDSSPPGSPLPPPPNPIFQFLPFPQYTPDDVESGGMFRDLDNYLTDRITRRNAMLTELSQRRSMFRIRLEQMETENTHLKTKLKDSDNQMSGKEKDYAKLEKKCKNLEMKLDTLTKAQRLYNKDKQYLESEILTFQEKISKEQQEKARIKRDMNGLVENEKTKWVDECQRQVRAKQSELHGEMWLKDEKLRQMKEILFSGDAGSPSKVRACIAEIEAKEERDRESLRSSLQDETPPPQPPPPTKTPIRPAASRSRAQPGAVAKKINQNKIRSKSPPAQKLGNPPLHKLRRRSKSVNIDWLEHKSTDHCNTDTLLQMQLKNKKTVVNPSVKNTIKASKYVLQHQSLDSEGEIETKLYKGDVFKSRGGGAAVQFTDVEVLRQRSPLKDRKRKSEDLENLPTNTEQMESQSTSDWVDDVKTRCAVAIEGHRYMDEPSYAHTDTKRYRQT